jgi:hypothetical protein
MRERQAMQAGPGLSGGTGGSRCGEGGVALRGYWNSRDRFTTCHGDIDPTADWNAHNGRTTGNWDDDTRCIVWPGGTGWWGVGLGFSCRIPWVAGRRIHTGAPCGHQECSGSHKYDRSTEKIHSSSITSVRLSVAGKLVGHFTTGISNQ